ncbi:hypothetical protein F6R97_29695 [Pseudomonas sp. JV414]|uniref:hypothetical protein n=1 Tax=Pseudomonas sp. JV414 TaxID=1733110 RepID=UPI0028E0FA2C|nr:hypothetical protein [Pseudomonas sp. JV414]MDT9678669.1 hypothetical protein [Pseudomonas sp. JV414]
MSEIDFSPKFVKAVNRMISHNSPGEVGLLMRWDNDDSMLWTIWSERFSDGPGIAGYNRRQVQRLEIKKGNLVACKPTVLGGHAEEIMIRSWDGYRKEVNKTDDPRIVDIFLTHSPCLDSSNIFSDEFGTWPKGCAPKLSKFINGIGKNIEWRIAFWDYYGSFSSRSNAIAAVEIIGKISNATIYKIFK